MGFKPGNKYRFKKKGEDHVEYQGAITPFFIGEFKYVICEGKKYMVPKGSFDGFRGQVKLFSLNHPVLYWFLMGCAIGLLLVSVVGIVFIFALIGFTRGGMEVFGMTHR